MGRSPLLTVIIVATAALAGCGGGGGAPGSDAGSHAVDGGAGQADGALPILRGNGGGASLGMVTAGVWDDNQNFDFYLDTLARTAAAPPMLGALTRGGRHLIEVLGSDGRPFAGAMVRVRAGQVALFEAPTAADGRVLLFPGWGATGQLPLTITATSKEGADTITLSATDPLPASTTLTLDAPGATTDALDVALIVDTTTSLADELASLQRDIEPLARELAVRFPDVPQRWALVLYRDVGDDYVTRTFDFTSDRTSFQRLLASESASGGGDHPQALDRALAEAGRLSWSPGAAARVAFLLTDAPHRAGRESALVDALARIRQLGVRLYPIAASGSDELTEVTLRTMATLTGGRYLFLTDDLRAGDPGRPCYLVTLLSAALRRMLTIELTGDHHEPPASEIVRAIGAPEGGRCTLPDGNSVALF